MDISVVPIILLLQTMPLKSPISYLVHIYKIFCSGMRSQIIWASLTCNAGCFTRAGISSHSAAAYVRVTFALISPALAAVLLSSCESNGYRTVVHCGFNFYFWGCFEVEQFFMSYSLFLFVKSVFKSFVHFAFKWFFFLWIHKTTHHCCWSFKNFSRTFFISISKIWFFFKYAWAFFVLFYFFLTSSTYGIS